MIVQPSLGVDEPHIREAERQLGVEFPQELTAVFRISNGLDLAGGWRLYPVLDPANPRKTCNSIVYENTKGRWPYMSGDLLSIAANETGNQLVLRISEGRAIPEILVWDHETGKVKRWSRGLDYLVLAAQKRVERIRRKIERAYREKPEQEQTAA